MIVSVTSCALQGVDAVPVTVEVDISPGNLPSYHVVGLPAASVREGVARIRAALQHVGQPMPRKKITVNLAPADLRKEGSAYDLPIAVAICLAEERIPPESVANVLFLGELGLDGSLRKVRGALAAALLARTSSMRAIFLPAASAGEAAELDDLPVFGARDLGEVLAFLAGTTDLARTHPPALATQPRSAPDLSDVSGQDMARLAVEIAVAGGHNVLLLGPPGLGKTMLARRIPGILPPLTREEALETTKVYSAVGLTEGGLVRDRPFRAPHHTVSTAGLVGGGRPARPGEVSLAHHGVLFLDELPEFQRSALESLRQPLEDREVTIARNTGTVTFPAAFLLVASANPCPCGWVGSRDRACTCGLGALERYRTRLSGPLLDRVDLQVFVESIPLRALCDGGHGETSATVRERVVAARDRQQHRLAAHNQRINAEMTVRALRESCPLTGDAERTLERINKSHKLTARALHRLIKVARTVADLNEEETITSAALLDAATFRPSDGGLAPA